MATKVRVEMDDTQKILLKRYLNKNGGAQIRFTVEFKRTASGKSDPQVYSYDFDDDYI